MDDPRPLGVGAARRAPGKRLRQRPAAVAPRRVDHHPRGLVHHQQVLVLEGDAERRRRTLGLGARARLVGGDGQALAPGEPVALGPRATVHQHPALVDQALRAGAGAQRTGQERVQALAGGPGGYVKALGHPPVPSPAPPAARAPRR